MSQKEINTQNSETKSARFFFIAVSLVAFFFMILMLSVSSSPEENRTAEDSRSDLIINQAEHSISPLK